MTRALILAGVLAIPACVVAVVAPSRAYAAQASPTDVRQASINLNVATAAELEKLPGVGPAMAARIVEYRQKNGGFKKIEDLMNVKGIGEKTFLRLKPFVTVTPAKTTDR